MTNKNQDSPTDQSRIDQSQLETALMHQEQQIQDLSDMVITQGRAIDRLERHILKMQSKITTLEDSADNSENMSVSEQAAMNKPPHY